MRPREALKLMLDTPEIDRPAAAWHWWVHAMLEERRGGRHTWQRCRSCRCGADNDCDDTPGQCVGTNAPRP